MVSPTDNLNRIKKLEKKEDKDEDKVVNDEYRLRQIVRLTMFITSAVVLFIMFGVFVYRNDFGILPRKIVKYTPQCQLGSIQKCNTSSGCEGTQKCITGEWSGCIVKQTCEPGTVQPCSIHNYGCINGISICNSCGTGFSECASPNTNTTQ